MIQSVREFSFENDSPLVEMWNVSVSTGERPFTGHSHSRFEIGVVNAGTGEYRTARAVYPIAPGDVFVFSSHEVHSITRVTQPLNVTNLHFEPRFLIEDNGENGFSSFCFFHSSAFENRIPAARAAFLRDAHSRIQREFEAGEPAYRDAIKAYLRLMAIDLLRRHRYRPEPLDKSAVPFDIAAVYAYIDNHFTEDVRLCDVARVASLSPNYFSHLFKTLNGISLWDYLLAKRVEKAARLLADAQPGDTLLMIAAQCGFNNTVHFNKTFKRLKGYTPGELRKNPKLLMQETL